MPQPLHDFSSWPIVLITLPAGEISENEFLAYLDALTAHHARGTRFARVIDVRASGALGANERRMLADRFDRDEDEHPGQLAGTAIVMSKLVHRGIFKALAWLYSKPQRREAFATSAANSGCVPLRSATTSLASAIVSSMLRTIIQCPPHSHVRHCNFVGVRTRMRVGETGMGALQLSPLSEGGG